MPRGEDRLERSAAELPVGPLAEDAVTEEPVQRTPESALPEKIRRIVAKNALNVVRMARDKRTEYPEINPDELTGEVAYLFDFAQWITQQAG